jgi:hypothetical protein
MKRVVWAIVAVVVAVISTSCYGGTITIVDKSQVPLPNVLVIVRSLNTGHEIGRFMTDPSGKIPSIDFKNDLYRIIATCPYGPCATTIREYFGVHLANSVVIEADRRAGYAPQFVKVSRKVTLMIQDEAQTPVAGIAALVRTPDAAQETWYQSNSDGSVEIGLPQDNAVLLLLAPRSHNVLIYTVAQDCTTIDPASVGASRCLEVVGGRVTATVTGK